MIYHVFILDETIRVTVLLLPIYHFQVKCSRLLADSDP